MSSLPVVLAQQGGPPASPEWPIAVFALGVAGLLWGLYRRAYQNSSIPTVPSDSHDGGSVYVLSNPGHDDLVKIGYTTRDAATRARELSGETGVPGDFEVEYEIEVANPERVEQAVHNRLADRKSSEDREFFEVAPDTARAAINAVLGLPRRPRHADRAGSSSASLFSGWGPSSHTTPRTTQSRDQCP